MAGLAASDPVLLLGTGLTMVDTVLSLLDQGHAGPIHAVSRRGLVPRKHATVAAPAFKPLPYPSGLRDLVRRVRADASDA